MLAKLILKYYIHYQRYKGENSIYKKILLDFCLDLNVPVKIFCNNNTLAVQQRKNYLK